MPKNLLTLLCAFLITACTISISLANGAPTIETGEIIWFGEGENVSATIRNYALIFGGLLGIIFAFWRTNIADRQQKTAESGQITDRYSKAVEQLGDEKNVSVRIGGLYALERIAKDSTEDLPTVQNVITNFLRYPPYQTEWTSSKKLVPIKEKIQGIRLPIRRLPFQDEKIISAYIPCPDIIVAIKVIKNISPDTMIDLTFSKWSHFDLKQTDLSNLNLSGSKLDYANFSSSTFQESRLNGASLEGATLDSTSFENSDLKTIHIGFLKDTYQTFFKDNNISHADISTLDIPESYVKECGFWAKPNQLPIGALFNINVIKVKR